MVPGLIALLSIDFLLPNPWLPTDGGGYAVFAVASFVFGGLVQAHASKATGERTDFKKSIALDESQDFSDLNMSSTGESEKETTTASSNSATLSRMIFRSLVDPTLLTDRKDRGEIVDDEILASMIRGHAFRRYDFDSESESVDVLYRLMLSEVDSDSGSSVSVRMHALRNLYRGVWIAIWYLLVLSIGGLLLGSLFSTCRDLPIVFLPSGYTTLADPAWQVPVAVFPLCLGFRLLTEYRNDDFVEYLFSDYARTITTAPDETTESQETDGRHREDSPSLGR
jgi:hypothetical protein